ncbi:hypothetical protein CRUP_031618 [Coryphaenoides rupestris]|nr:hypothetical protein CRUP_031618 [Coryphaenoides rupestris]
MVAQLAEVDPLGNKEPDARRTKEPHLNQSQVCPASTPTTTTTATTIATPAASIPSPDHTEDIRHTAPAKNALNSQPSSKDRAPVAIASFTDLPAPANGNREILSPMATGDRSNQRATEGSSLTGRGVSTPAEGRRDDQNNATPRMRTPEEKEAQDTSTAGLTSDVAASKVEALTLNNVRARGPCIAPRESSSEPPAPPMQGGGTSTARESPSGNAEQKKMEMVPPQPTIGNAAVPRATKPSPASHGQSAAGAMDLNSNLTHAERGPPPAYSTRITSDKHQPTPNQRGSSAVPQAVEDRPACREVAEKAIATGTMAGPKSGPKLYSEASTMTSGSSTPTKQHQDVEVQAVASTCSRAVSTSPSLLPLSAVHRPSTGIPLVQDKTPSLAVLYKAEGGSGGGGGGSGSGPGPLLHHRQTGPSQSYMESIACTVDTAVQGVVVEAATCGDRNAKAVVHTEGDQVARTKPKQDNNPAASHHVQTAAPPLKPVYQINIEHSAQREGKMAAVAHPAVSSQSTSKLCKTTLSDPPGVPVISTVETPTAKASSSQLPPSQGTTSANKPKQGDNMQTAAQPQSTDTTKASQAMSIPANTNSKSKMSKAATECPKDQQPKVGGKASAAKEICVDKQSLELERMKKEEVEEGEEEDDEQKGKGVHEVVWDEQGMTWEVYGAGVDPESLGFAIQSHLQCKIKEQERKLVSKTSQRKSITAAPTVAAADSPRRGGRKKQRRRQNIFRSMLRNVRRPQCCSRPSPASVLD